MQLNCDAYQPQALNPLNGETANSQVSDCAFIGENFIGLTQKENEKCLKLLF